MATKNLYSVFIGVVDILGYKTAEKHIDQYGPQAASAIIERMYNALDTHTSSFNNNSDAVHWIRYGDGYVFYSETKDVEQLTTMIKSASHLIALSLCQSIPLRIAITQGDIKIIKPQQDGLSITGAGWDALQNLEKALDWMGGWLYLPGYDNHHHPTITELIRTTHLIVQQNNCSEHTQNFTAPFKNGKTYSKEKSWFLNWHKILKQNNLENQALINHWWQPYAPGNINNPPDVKNKQRNTLAFANYCDLLNKSAKLIYHSKINTDLKIEEIYS